MIAARLGLANIPIESPVSRSAEEQEANPPRHVYTITDVGRELLHDMLADLEHWIAGAPRLACDRDSLTATYRRSLVDLAALRYTPVIAGSRSPACGRAAVVHDDVRA